ncbi:MAG: heme lyase CcmF/NrfE family subunit [Alphaproteobacteria bacterium]|nr:heme lyase CcmF/NrfE family subunit [Alphaproteobacteria bacterium]
MIPELGVFALAVAFVVTLVQSTVPLLGAARGDARLMAVGSAAATAQLLFIAVAFAILTLAYVRSDFSVANVAENSHTLKPLLYRITGVWGNHEGSMVLWVLILAAFGWTVAALGHNLPPSLKARVLAVQGIIGALFLAFILFTSNPFERIVPVPVEGRGLNPLLQDPGLAFHPPFLYLGYVGFSMAFAFAVAALIEGRVDPAWARWVRPWTLAAWCALTVGIALGSWWAYYELGWGGFWFWDPVENASFLPWLVGTALLHSAIVVEKRDALKTWTVLLAIITFGLSLLGTFLVRSGVLTSVHSFAVDPARGVFILGILILLLGGAFALYAARAPALKGGGLFAPVSREGALVLNNLLLCTAAAVVLVGTLYPLVLDAFGGGKVSVGPPFFNLTFVPIMVPTLLAVVVGAMLSWKRGDLAGVMGRLWLAAGAAGLVAVATLGLGGLRHALAALGFALAVWLVVGIAVDLAARLGLGTVGARDCLRRAAKLPRSAWGMAVAHAGLGVVVAGITASAHWQVEELRLLRPGETVALASYAVTFDGARQVRGPNYSAWEGRLVVRDGDRLVATLLPQKRFYPAEGQTTTEAAIHTTWLADIYVVLGKAEEGGAWSVRLYHNPLVPWIWVGAVVMALGGMLSLSDRRHRVGAPRRAARAGSEPSAAKA